MPSGSATQHPSPPRYQKMNQQEQFTMLMLGNELGLVGLNEIKEAADEELQKVENPEYWLVEFSIEGKSKEFQRIESEAVIRKLTGKAYQFWRKEEIDEEKFKYVIKMLAQISGYESHIGSILDWVEDDLELIRIGVLKREDQIQSIYEEIEKII
jgi:hypothetical protein